MLKRKQEEVAAAQKRIRAKDATAAAAAAARRPTTAPLNRPRPEPALARKGAKARGKTLDGTLSLCPPLETHGNARGTAGAC